MERERVRRCVLISSMASLILLLSLSPIVFAGWDEVSVSGEWGVCSRISWSVGYDDGVGEALWKYDDFMFEGYESSIKFSYFSSSKANWWDYQDNKRVTLLWNFSDIYVYVSFLEQHNLFGYIEDRWVQVATSEDSTAFTTSADFWWNPFGVQTERDDFRNFPSTVEVVMDKISATEVRIVILNCRDDTVNDVLMWDSTYVVSADWFAHNNLTLSIYHAGHGTFCGGMSDTVYETEFSPSYDDTEDIQGFGIWDFIDNLLGGAVRVLPSWLQDFVGMLGGWFSMFNLSFITQFLGVVFPILPYFLLFWILDAVASCIFTGNVSPLGVCFSTILHFGSSVVGVLVSIVSAIYDFFHFW